MKGRGPIRSEGYMVISKPRSILKIARFLTVVHRTGRKLTTAGFQTELVRGDFDVPIPALLKVIDRYGNRVDL
jgi:hypothetical protein